MWDRLLTDCNIATMDSSVAAPFGAIEDGAIAIQDGRIVRVGRRVELVTTDPGGHASAPVRGGALKSPSRIFGISAGSRAIHDAIICAAFRRA